MKLFDYRFKGKLEILLLVWLKFDATFASSLAPIFFIFFSYVELF